MLTDSIWSHSRHFRRPKQGQNNPAANFRQKGVWSPMHIDHLTFYGPSQYLSSFLSNMPNFHFWLISLSIPPKKVSNSCTLNFDATDLPHSYVVWTVIPQNFQGYPKSRPSVIGLAASTLQSKPIPKVIHDFWCFLVFFDRISFPAQTVNFCL